jgi:phytoene dehydrogenase-like protein
MVVKQGGEVFEGEAAVEILFEKGRASAVRLEDGRIFKARKFVVSTLNPHQTFLQLMDSRKIDPQLKKRAENFKYSQTTPIVSIHLALKERPMYLAAEYEPDVMKGWLISMGVDGTEDIHTLEQDCRAGRVPSGRQLFGGVPTIFDPSQAPEGYHAAWFWQVAPYSLKEGPEHWDVILDEVCESRMELIREFAPNINKDTIVDWFGTSPLDIERHLPNMQHGDWMCGELSPDQFLDKRPFPECSRYRTPIEGLYLAGSCCHPGGNITGAPGYNAANIITEDMGAERWWNPPDLEKIWSNLPASE